MNFDELTKAISATNVLAKALAAPVGSADKTIKAAAAEGAAAGGAASTTEEEEDETNGGGGVTNGQVGDGTPTPLAKSFKLLLEDGTEVDAEDGTALIKALSTQLTAETSARAADNDQFMKAFGSTIELVTSLTAGLTAAREETAAAKNEIATLKGSFETLQKSLSTLAGKGRGRVSTLSIIDKPNGDGTRPVNVEYTANEILAKATAALSANRITGTEATKVMTALNMGLMPEKEMVDRIFAN